MGLIDILETHVDGDENVGVELDSFIWQEFSHKQTVFNRDRLSCRWIETSGGDFCLFDGVMKHICIFNTMLTRPLFLGISKWELERYLVLRFHLGLRYMKQSWIPDHLI